MSTVHGSSNVYGKARRRMAFTRRTFVWKKIYEYAMIFDTRLLRALHSRNLQNMSKKSRGARMRLTGIHIKSFRAIRDVTIDSVENALILVGQNNTGKSNDNRCAACGAWRYCDNKKGFQLGWWQY